VANANEIDQQSADVAPEIAQQSFDVAIVGTGPVGLMIANFLGLYGIRVVILEQLDKLIDYPRAIGLDDESLRTFQAVGLVEEVLPHTTPNHWMRFTTASGRIFASIEPRTDEFGWPRRNAFIQPLADGILYRGLQRFPHVSVLFSHAVSGFEQDDEGVTLNVENVNGDQNSRTTVRARYMIGCDGGNSIVRRTLGIPFEGRTKPNQWIVVDVRNDPLGTPHIYLHCDPERPYVSAALPHGIRRFEFMVMPGETEEELRKPENLHALMRKVVPRPEKVDFIRQRVYTHNARLADTFRLGRVLLAGDAAHIMPVWQGQGYNSGMRDANNIAWKLAMVVKGIASDELLDSYNLERRDHARSMIHLSEVAGDIFAPENPSVAKWRDTITLALNAVPQIKQYVVEMRFKPMPRYEKGVVVLPQPQENGKRPPGLFGASEDSALGRLIGLVRENRDSKLSRLLEVFDQPEQTPVGRLFIQPRVLTEEGKEVLLDEVIGLNFAVIAWGTDPTYGLTPEARAFWDKLGARFISAIPASQLAVHAKKDNSVITVGDIGTRLKDWFANQSRSIVCLRPDRFVAALTSQQEISETTAAFAQVLCAEQQGD
jgi:3-(3-hydroxy-phenyl)propionate hydroxylase